MEIALTVPSSVPPSAAPAQTNLAAKRRDSRKSSTPAFLSNLPRGTLRGIRKCPQCGVFNGTRGVSCKNRACLASLRRASVTGRASKKCALEVVKVIIDSQERGAGGVLGSGPSGGAQVFSVRHRVRGAAAAQCGFVELVPTDTAIATGNGPTLLTRINLGHCFLPSCRQGQGSDQGESNSAAGGKQSSDSLCIHIKQAIECRNGAVPLTLKSSVLEGIQASIQVKEDLWRLATESPGPLVQRVSKDTLVVKCHTDSRHPLGLLHLTVGAGGLLEGLKSERSVFQCACQVNTRTNKSGDDVGSGPLSSPPSSVPSQPCLHYYACVCALASDEKLASEFSAFISYTSSVVQQSTPNRSISPSEKPLQQAEPASPQEGAEKKQLEETVPGTSQAVDERSLKMGFHQWLASVTERIHHTMHYQSDGKPPPLVFHIPNEFFNALQQRLSLGTKKRRLPTFTTPFVRNDKLPQGSFYKYTWHITSQMQVKHIFDTPELPLEFSQSFVKNADGSYSHFRCPEPPPEPELPEGHRASRPQAIRPMELRTFLKVGSGTADQKDACPFVIEWIPDVLPRCQMGELRISFQFGHQQSGEPEYHQKISTEVRGHDKSDCAQLKIIKTVDIIQVVI
ncbi:uncharacterized protein C2orf42 homolog isoform 2-T2 [Pholidichthys leucotaenia]